MRIGGRVGISCRASGLPRADVVGNLPRRVTESVVKELIAL